MWAAAQSQPEMIRPAVEAVRSVDERATVRDWQRRVTAEGRPKDMNRGGFTPLLFAAREGCVDCLQALLRQGGADIDLPDPDGVTALIMALLNRNWDAARVPDRGGRGRQPVGHLRPDAAVRGRGHEHLARGQARGAAVAWIAAPARIIVRLLLEQGANPNAQLKLRPRYRNIPNDRYRDPMIVWGTTPLLRAAKAGDVPW